MDAAVTGGALGYAAAFGGGVASFLSPCVLPIVPGYLSVITGLDGAATAGKVLPGPGQAARIAGHTGAFIAGFTAVFVLLGLTATSVGRALTVNHLLLTRVSGALVVGMAAVLAGSFLLRAPRLYGERRFHPELSRFGPFAAPVAGAAFGFGWTPCIGPVLGSVLAVAAAQGQAARGALLLAFYSAGIGVPFLLAGLAVGRLGGAFARVRTRLRAISIASAVVMAGFGVLLILNRLTWVTIQLQSALSHVGLSRLLTFG